MMYVTYATSTDGDWAALYINGRLAPHVEQNHSLQIDHVITGVLDAVGEGNVGRYRFEHIEVDMEEGMADWLGARGLPEYLSQIPPEARS